MSIYLWLKFFHMIGVVMMLGATFCNGVVHLNAMKAKSKVDRFDSLNNILEINKLIMFPGFILGGFKFQVQHAQNVYESRRTQA